MSPEEIQPGDQLLRFHKRAASEAAPVEVLRLTRANEYLVEGVVKGDIPIHLDINLSTHSVRLEDVEGGVRVCIEPIDPAKDIKWPDEIETRDDRSG